MMAVFFYVLVATADDGPLVKAGHEIVGSKGYYSEQSCIEDARLIAQGMFVKDGTKYGFRCVKVNYEPPNLTHQTK